MVPEIQTQQVANNNFLLDPTIKCAQARGKIDDYDRQASIGGLTGASPWFHEHLRKITNSHFSNSQQLRPTNTQPRVFLVYSKSSSDRDATSVWQGCCLLPGRSRARGGKGSGTFSNYESMRQRMDEIKKRLVGQWRVRKAAGSEHNAINN